MTKFCKVLLTALFGLMLCVAVASTANAANKSTKHRLATTIVKVIEKLTPKHVSKRERNESLIPSRQTDKKSVATKKLTKKVAKKILKSKPRKQIAFKKQTKKPETKIVSLPTKRSKTKQAKILKSEIKVVSRISSKFQKRKVIRNNPGGQVVAFAIEVAKLRVAGTPVVVKGRCDSACTLHLGLPSNQLCITRGATFGFHQASFSFATAGKKLVKSDVATNFMMQNYPSWVKSWIASKGGLRRNIKTMPYSYASQFLSTCTS